MPKNVNKDGGEGQICQISQGTVPLLTAATK
jgi:hypothetical protein